MCTCHKSRFIVSFGVFDEETTENALTVLENAIEKYGKPTGILTDHGSQFYSNLKVSAERGKSKFEKFEKFLRVFDECLKNVIDSIFEVIPIDWKTNARNDLYQLRISIKNTRKDKLREVIKNSTLLGSVI